ncbi:hypothetical protein Bca4012_033502 [Brassica carinata]
MDRISSLPDDLILRIVSFPRTEVAITTSLLSKGWRDVWKHVPKLEYYQRGLGGSANTVAISRDVRKLRFHNYPFGPKEDIRLPGSLYTCQTLVTLRLLYTFIVDVPLTICFPSLKTLRLRRVEFSNDEIVPRILSGCPVLEDLTVVREHNGSVKNITIMVPSLLRLTVLDFKFGSQVPGNDVGFVIKAPSLKSLTVVSQVSWVCSLVNMPNLVKANIKLPLHLVILRSF